MRSTLRAADVLPAGTVGLRARPARAALSALGVALGIAAVVAVLGVTRSSQADLVARLDRLGTNLLTVANGRSLGGAEARLPVTAAAAAARTDGVLSAAPTAELTGVRIYRSDRVPAYLGGGLAVRAVDPALLATLDGRLVRGVFLNGATATYPATVLGHAAARSLGVGDLAGPPRVFLGGRWFTVVGILAPCELAPEIDSSALIGFGTARSLFGHDGSPGTLYVRADTARTAEVAGLLARAVHPADPAEVAVSRPSDALAARLAVTGAATALLLGLGAVALLVGGVGIANVMVISVLERRAEIGLRRAVGAARRHVAIQFAVESVLLGAVGGVAGVLLGAAVTVGLAYQRGWPPVVPAAGVWAALGAAVGVGAVAGVYPALRAARLAPTEALRA
ncbi:MAG TPA: ABC transporter permease [Pilimelia sp.]|nr:ABC transporter permease [Pilimelia sp.]